MKIIPLAEAKARLSAYVDECASNGPILITRNGKPAAVLLAPQDDDDLDQLMLPRSPRFQALLQKSRKSIAAGKGLSSDEFWKAVKAKRGKSGA
jgi:prevent-host-death family protein